MLSIRFIGYIPKDGEVVDYLLSIRANRTDNLSNFQQYYACHNWQSCIQEILTNLLVTSFMDRVEYDCNNANEYADYVFIKMFSKPVSYKFCKCFPCHNIIGLTPFRFIKSLKLMKTKHISFANCRFLMSYLC